MMFDFFFTGAGVGCVADVTGTELGRIRGGGDIGICRFEVAGDPLC